MQNHIIDPWQNKNNKTSDIIKAILVFLYISSIFIKKLGHHLELDILSKNILWLVKYKAKRYIPIFKKDNKPKTAKTNIKHIKTKIGELSAVTLTPNKFKK